MNIWLAAIAVLATVGFFLLIRVGLDDVAAIVMVLRRRLRRRIVLDRHSVPIGANLQVRTTAFHRSPLGLGLVVGLMLGSAWLSSPLLSVWFIVFGALAGWVIQRSRSEGRAPGGPPTLWGSVGYGQDLRAMEVFVSTLRSVFVVGQSIFNSLELAVENMEPGPLHAAVAEAVRHYRGDLNASDALAALKSLHWTHLSRLALVLDQISQADEETVRATLLDLEGRVRTARRVHDRASTVLTLSRMTLRVLQAANITALIAVTFLPTWRSFYSENPFALIAATGMALAGSAYFALEMNRMERAI
jgi:hypothetical protein